MDQENLYTSVEKGGFEGLHTTKVVGERMGDCSDSAEWWHVMNWQGLETGELLKVLFNILK